VSILIMPERLIAEVVHHIYFQLPVTYHTDQIT